MDVDSCKANRYIDKYENFPGTNTNLYQDFEISDSGVMQSLDHQRLCGDLHLQQVSYPIAHLMTRISCPHPNVLQYTGDSSHI